MNCGCGVRGGNNWSIVVIIIILLFVFLGDKDSSTCY